VNQRSVRLDDAQERVLRELALREGREPDDLVREALDDYLARRRATSERPASSPRWQIAEREWRARFEALLDRIRADVPPDLNPEEIELEITAARTDKAAATPPIAGS
jgi:hypothetical protein